MAPVELQNDRLHLVVDPDQGAGILAFSALAKDRWVPLMPDARRPDCDLACACFLMIPYSNRVENGAFTFASTAYQLENAVGHAIHGDTRKRPWDITGQSAQLLCCTFSSAEHNRVNWPWPFDAEATFEVSDNHLLLGLKLTNRGATAMPASFGWHPYFSRALQQEGEPVALQLALDGSLPRRPRDAHPLGSIGAARTAPGLPHREVTGAGQRPRYLLPRVLRWPHRLAR